MMATLDEVGEQPAVATRMARHSQRGRRSTLPTCFCFTPDSWCFMPGFPGARVGISLPKASPRQGEARWPSLLSRRGTKEGVISSNLRGAG